MKYTLTITRWHPARLNSLIGCHWGTRSKHKRQDRKAIAAEAFNQRIPKATCKRRVSLVLTLGPRQRAGDPDGYWKSLLDALAHAGLLLDDNRQGVELGEVRFDRGKVRQTEIVLEDLPAKRPRKRAPTVTPAAAPGRKKKG